MSGYDSRPATHAYRLGVASVNILLDYALEQGLDEAHCLRETGLTRQLLVNPEAEIDPAQELALIRILSETLGAPFKHGFTVGLRYHLTASGVWGLGLMSMRNGLEAAQWGSRNVAAGSYAFIKYQFSVLAGSPMLIMDDRHLPDDVRSFLVARDLGSIWNLHHDLLPNHPFGVSEVRLTQSRCEALDQVEALYQCPILTGQSEACLVLNAAILQAAFPRANAITAGQCERYCQELIERRQVTRQLADRVRHYLRENGLRENGLRENGLRENGLRENGLRGNDLRESKPRESEPQFTSLKEVASAFNLSERSFRRQLQQEGVSWRQLRDEVLAESAKRQLRIGRFSIRQVGEQLGYAEVSSFSHAFKRWTGVSPAEYCREVPVSRGHG